MKSDELCRKLSIDQATLAALLADGLPHAGSKRQPTFDASLVREWLLGRGLAAVDPHVPAEPFLLRTVQEVARFFGVSTKTVREWLSDSPPMPGRCGPRGKQDGYFPIHEIRDWLKAREARQEQGNAPSVERDRLLRAKRQLAEFTLRVKRGELLPADEVRGTLLRVMHEMRAQLDQLPGAVLRTLPDGLDRAVRDRVRERIGRSLASCYAGLHAAIEGAADDEDDQPPPVAVAPAIDPPARQSGPSVGRRDSPRGGRSVARKKTAGDQRVGRGKRPSPQ